MTFLRPPFSGPHRCLSIFVNSLYNARARCNRGFTYIEVLLAVTIVSYVSLAFIQTLMNNIKAEKLAKYKTMAYNEAVNWIEDCIIENGERKFDAAKISTITYQTYATAKTGDLVSGMPYILEQQVALSSLGENGKYKTIRVKVSWTERGESREINYATIKAKYDND